jgi:hypothetical protein
MPPNKEQRERLQFGFDGVNDAAHGVDHQVNTPCGLEAPLWQQYARGAVACHFHLGVYFRREGYLHNLCADFQRFPRGEPPLRSVGAGPSVPKLPGVSERSGMELYWVECPVFVPVGEVAERGEGAVRGVRSVVGLRPVDDCPLSEWDFAEMYPLIDKRLGVILNRELNLFAQGLGPGDSEVMATEGVEQVFKPAPEIVNNIPDDDANPERPVLRNARDAKHMITRLRIELGAELDAIGFSFEDGRHYFLQEFAMLARPLDFGSTLGKVNRHGPKE